MFLFSLFTAPKPFTPTLHRAPNIQESHQYVRKVFERMPDPITIHGSFVDSAQPECRRVKFLWQGHSYIMDVWFDVDGELYGEW